MRQRRLKIEILYIEDCPNHRATVSLLEDISNRAHLDAEIEEIEVKDLGTATAMGFLGSPTVRVNGLDIEPDARASREFGMMCRVYASGGRRVGVPPEDVLWRAFQEAAGKAVI